MARRVAVRVPATTANLGPGFDALGMALGLYNTVVAEPGDGPEVVVEGEGADRLPRDARNLVYRSAEEAARRIGGTLPPLRLRCANAIPPARGLGSSSAAIVAGLMIGNALLGGPWDPEQVLATAAELEGHPDNVTPAVFGGLQVCVVDRGRVCHVAVPVERRLRVALFIPDVPMATRGARRVVPRRVSLADAVHNLGRTALLVAAMATGRLDVLGVATQDRLHQPPRAALFPALPILLAAAMEHGALGAFLSGAGSTVAALVDERGEMVAEAMARTAAREGVTGRARVVEISQEGAHYIDGEA
ncbi:MAG TPA: homoserine kinase [Chloroflexota bacterium]